jgi:hypothetical protein
MELENWHNAMALFTQLDSELRGIALGYLATKEKIFEISRTPWHDPSLERRENKYRMKELGGATFTFIEFLHENSIMALAKVIEDTSIELKRYGGFKFEVFSNDHGVIYLKELRTIRALANVIKHNVSRIERSKSKSAKFLVDECGMPNGTSLDALILTNHSSFDIVRYIPKVYLAMLWLIEKAFGIKHALLKIDEDEAFDTIFGYLIPDIIDLPRPTRKGSQTNET